MNAAADLRSAACGLEPKPRPALDTVWLCVTQEVGVSCEAGNANPNLNPLKPKPQPNPTKPLVQVRAHQLGLCWVSGTLVAKLQWLGSESKG